MRKVKRSPIGLDIGRHSVKAVQLSGVRGGWRMSAAAMVPREDPSAELSAAEVHAVAQVLGRQGFVGNTVVVAAPGEKILGGILETPPASSGAPMEVIARTELAAMHRVEPGGFEMACWELPGGRGREGTRVMAAACPHAFAHPYLDLLEAGGLDVLAMDTESTASARMCASTAAGQLAMLPLVDLGWSAARLMLLHQGTVTYERRLSELGLGSLRAVLVEQLKFDATVADFLLKEIGLGEAKGGAELVQLEEAHAAIGAHLDPLVRELGSALAYAEHEYGQLGEPVVQMMGGGAVLPGAAGYLADLMGLGVSPLTSAMRMECTESTRRLGETPLLNVAAGLAMHEAGGR
jgi:Tfp pilus assembly PilM family ATPase